MKKKLIMPLIIVSLCLTMIGMYIFLLTSINSKGNEIEFNIKQGDSKIKIVKNLKDNKLIRSQIATNIYIKLHKINNLQAGTYLLNQKMNVEKILNVFQTGQIKSEEIKMTFPEGYQMRQVVSKIVKETNNQEADIYNLLKDEKYLDTLINKYDFLTDVIKNENIYYSLEGYLFPDTYFFKNKDVTVEEIFEKMLDQTANVLTSLNIKEDYHNTLTLASIVQSESLTEKDMDLVASVFKNRLKIRMPLGSCVTTYYAFKIDMGERNLYASEVSKENPYNTRGPNMVGKLPVGPISNPGEAALKAVIKEAKNDYLYFVSDKNRNLYFTKTFAEHNNKIMELKNKGLWYEW